MPPFLAKKRSRLITGAVAGTLTMATAITAAAVMMPSANAAVSAGTADTHLTSVTTRQDAAQAAHGDAMSSAQRLVGFEHVRFTLGERQNANDVAVAQAAAAKAAHARAAVAAKAAAVKAAAAKAQTARLTSSTPSGTPQQMAQQMLGSYGWSSSEMSCLYPLWFHESGWNPSAQNAGSGAYGIPQALPGSQMASAGSDWQTNPATQIKWGLSYIHDRYGSPCGAWAHEQSSNWY